MAAKQSPFAVILLSGGLDSMVAAGLAREDGHKLFALSIDYNQRHRVELHAAREISISLNVMSHIVLPLDLSAFGGSALTADIAVPKSGLAEGIPVTYVPARNAIFLSLTLGLAEVASASDIYIGVNAVDYSGYPDCRPEFIAAFEKMAGLATKAGVEGNPVRLRTPLQFMSKAEIIREGMRLGLDLGLSWSCYDPVPFANEHVHCGVCDSCRIRRRGFDEAGVADPTRYVG